ncbi:MAG: hypothetical protein ABH891_07095 [Candidatus Omnitrophota bacterium]
MGANKRKNQFKPFVALERELLKNPAWRSGLTSSEKILYIHLKYKFNGANNGDICLHYSEMEDIMASATIAKAFKGLEQKEWIERSRTVGGKYRFTTYYKLTGRYDNAISRFKL